MDELKKLTDLATRQSIKDVLAIETRRLETEISLQLKDNMFNLETKPAQATNTVRCYDVKLTNYGNKKKLRVYVKESSWCNIFIHHSSLGSVW